MKQFSFLLVISIFIPAFVGAAQANELSGVKIDKVITVSPGGKELRLKGAAIQSNARQAVYVGGLYLQNDEKTVDDILHSKGAKRFVLYCENSSIKPAALIRAINLGISVNHSAQQLDALRPMIDKFNTIWSAEISEGDQVWIDYLPEKGTVITINGLEKGIIPGEAFYQAFLKTWLGDRPLNPKMKKQLLGQ